MPHRAPGGEWRLPVENPCVFVRKISKILNTSLSLHLTVVRRKVRSHQTRMKRYARMIYMFSQCKDTIDNPAVLFAQMARITRRELIVWRAICANYEWRQKIETTTEDKVIVVVCGYPELYIHLRTFTKTEIHFATRLELPGRSPSHDAYSCLLCSEFHTRMARISRVNEASKLKNVQASNYARIARFIRFIRIWCECTWSLSGVAWLVMNAESEHKTPVTN